MNIADSPGLDRDISATHRTGAPGGSTVFVGSGSVVIWKSPVAYNGPCRFDSRPGHQFLFRLPVALLAVPLGRWPLLFPQYA